jgi:mono/diheme cytochrome c family protein
VIGGRRALIRNPDQLSFAAWDLLPMSRYRAHHWHCFDRLDRRQPYASLYTNLGCVNCHGPNGLGGVPNPLSADKAIPPLSGEDFTSEFNTPAKIRDIIVSGSVLGKAPIVSMPHWGSILTDADVNQLIAYIGTLS